MKRTFAVIALTGSLALLGGGAAMATTYPAPAPGVAVSDATVTPGEAITFSGTGFTPGETVNITVTNEGSGTGTGAGTRAVSSKITLPSEAFTLSAVADATGAFSTKVALNEAGTYTLTATGVTSGRTQTAVVTVNAPQAALAANQQQGTSKEGLATTGADEGLVLWAGAGAAALALGVGSVVAVRRRAKDEAATTVA